MCGVVEKGNNLYTDTGTGKTGEKTQRRNSSELFKQSFRALNLISADHLCLLRKAFIAQLWKPFKIVAASLGRESGRCG